MKNYWQLREDLTAAQKKTLKSDYDITGFNPKDEKLLLKINKGKRDENGVPDLTGITLCDIVSLNTDDFRYLLRHVGSGFFSRQSDDFIMSGYKVRGWYTFDGMLDKIREVFGQAFGDELMGSGKSEVVHVFRNIKSCSTRGDWARFAGGTLYRGKKISWKKFKQMPWRVSSGGRQLECTATYQSKLAMQSWTTDLITARSFASGHEGAMSGLDLEIPERWDDRADKEVYGKDITGFLPVIIQAVIPAKDCLFNPNTLDKIQKAIDMGGLNEKEVLRVSTEPIKAKFFVTRQMLEYSTVNDEQVDHIFNIISKRK